MEKKIKKQEKNSKTFWQFTIAAIGIILVVLAGGVIVILLQGGHIISGKEALYGAVFPLVLFIPIWIALSRKAGDPTPGQAKIIKTMIIAAIILFAINVLVFWRF